MRIPFEEEFGGSDFLDSEEIKELGERIIAAKFPDYDGEVIIDYRWKRHGGASGGNDILGKCIRLTGLARHLSLGAHYCIWLAAEVKTAWAQAVRQAAGGVGYVPLLVFCLRAQGKPTQWRVYWPDGPQELSQWLSGGRRMREQG